MAVITNPSYLTPVSQTQQLFSSLDSLLSSLTESTESAFRKVHVSKKDSAGNIKFYNVKETVVDASGQSIQQVRRVDTLTYIEDVKTGDLYLPEANYIVAVKCALVALGIPFYAAGKMAWYAVKTPLEIGILVFDKMFVLGKVLYECKFSEVVPEIRNAFTQISGTLGTGIFEIVKAPIFAIGCDLAAIYGIFRPYHGRKFEALIEHAWQQGASYKEDLRNVPPRDGENCWTAFVKDLRDSHPFYLAHCFQVRGNVNEPRVVVKGRAPL